MKKPPSKTDLRERLQRQTAAFLSSGGKVKEFQAGESAYDRSETPPPAPLFETRRAERTPLLIHDGLQNAPELRSFADAPQKDAGKSSMTILASRLGSFG